MGDRPSGLSELTTEVRRQSGQSGLMIHPVAGSAESVTAGIARLRISRPSCDEQRTQPRHAPPFVIDIASEDPSNAVGDDTVIEQICDVVTAIAG